jgi:hypothetical protein
MTKVTINTTTGSRVVVSKAQETSGVRTVGVSASPFDSDSFDLAFDKANVANNLAKSGYDQANTSYTQANSAYTQANLVFSQANTAYTKANTANVDAVAAFTLANSTNVMTYAYSLIAAAALSLALCCQ